MAFLSTDRGSLLCIRCSFHMLFVRFVHFRETKGASRAPAVSMPPKARANGLWRGPDPPEIMDLSYVERRVIALARVYVSIKRVYFPGRDNRRMRPDETPRYHQKNVVAYPQNPDKVVRAVGVRPDDL